MIHIRLPRNEWDFDPDAPLAPKGGFGQVFAGLGPESEEIAVKRLHEDVASEAHRELRMAEELIGKSFENVLTVLDAGYDEGTGRFYIIMPKAETDLHSVIQDRGPFTEGEAIEVLVQIARGLTELPGIVHRDLKPGNVLYHQGNWKVADFGIARFVEKSTSLRTLKGFLTDAFAAPEQWRYERATRATDIYALGVISFLLLSGKLPFTGPSRADFKRQHLEEDPPFLKSVSSRLASLVTIMLRKQPESRPSHNRVITLLSEQSMALQNPEPRGPGLISLSKASAESVKNKAKVETKKARKRSALRLRLRIASSGRRAFRSLIGDFAELLDRAAPDATISVDKMYPLTVWLGSASLVVDFLDEGKTILADAFVQSGWNVVLGGYIKVSQTEPTEYEWAANLWYTDLGEYRELRWWEVSYMSIELRRIRDRFEPFSLTDFTEADRAAASALHTVQFAADPRPVDDEAASNFYDRWAGVLAIAFRGRLAKPRNLPFSWNV